MMIGTLGGGCLVLLFCGMAIVFALKQKKNGKEKETVQKGNENSKPTKPGT